VDQLALLEFMERGWYDRHLAWARRRYRTRREALLAALAEELPDWRPSGTAAGLHFLLNLPAGGTARQAAAVVRAAAAREVVVADVERYRAWPGSQQAALVIGYGNLADTAVGNAAAHLAAAARGCLALP
jgi:GntR family transcriptional regulator/MocR family aminotransferase